MLNVAKVACSKMLHVITCCCTENVACNLHVNCSKTLHVIACSKNVAFNVLDVIACSENVAVICMLNVAKICT